MIAYHVLHDMAANGEGGMKLLSENFTEYKRYGQAVTKVNNLGPDDLVRLQNEGFVSIYSKYWRWLPVLKRHGIIGLLLTFYRMVKMIKDKIEYKTAKFRRKPLLDQQSY